jgi:hypothetical protein
MSGNFNNRTLLLVFVLLALIFVLTRVTSLKKADQSLITDYVEIDTSQVTLIRLYPFAESGNELIFSKSGASWRVTRGEINAAADAGAVERTLTALMNMKPEQLVSRSRERWSDYHVNDSLGTRIIVEQGKRAALDMVVGRFQYEPPPQNSYNPYGQNRGSGKTFIRMSGTDEVYTVDGFLAMSVNQAFDRWRDQNITRMNSAQLNRIVFDYPADSGYVAEKTEAGWMVAGLLADSANMANYVNGVSRKTHREFADDFTSEGEPDFRVSFEGDNMLPLEVRAFQSDANQLILNSSINPDSWFRVKREDLFKEIFRGSEELISGNSSSAQ